MKSNKGFLLLQELMYMCLAAMLLTMAVLSLCRATATMQQSHQLAECARAAQQLAAGEDYCGSVIMTQSKIQLQELSLLEVQASYGKAKYTLIQATGLSAAGAGAGVYDSTADNNDSI